MIETLDLFIDVFFFPIDPANLDFTNNPIMICLTAILVGMGIGRFTFELLRMVQY